LAEGGRLQLERDGIGRRLASATSAFDSAEQEVDDLPAAEVGSVENDAVELEVQTSP
jgi:hypothetical protein